MSFPRHLRYSPLNYLIVDWGFNGVAFDNCGLPDPLPCPEPPSPRPEACCPLPITEAIDTYDWERWLPEVIVGIEDPDEEIAASYVREAAIEFAKYTRALQRQILIPLQRGVCTYGVEPYDQEQIIGVLGASIDNCQPCAARNCAGELPNGVPFRLDVARNEFTLLAGNGDCCRGAKLLKILVWSAPSEDACAQDVFLYDRFRRDIAQLARLNYAQAMHFRDRELMRSLPSRQEVERNMALAKNKATSAHSWSQTLPGSGMWQRAGGRR